MRIIRFSVYFITVMAISCINDKKMEHHKSPYFDCEFLEFWRIPCSINNIENTESYSIIIPQPWDTSYVFSIRKIDTLIFYRLYYSTLSEMSHLPTRVIDTSASFHMNFTAGKLDETGFKDIRTHIIDAFEIMRYRSGNDSIHALMTGADGSVVIEENEHIKQASSWITFDDSATYPLFSYFRKYIKDRSCYACRSIE